MALDTNVNDKGGDPNSKAEYLHLEAGGTGGEGLAAESDPWKTVRQEADAGEDDEHKLTLSKLKKSPVCEAWSQIAAADACSASYGEA